MTDDDTDDRMRWIRLRKHLDEWMPAVVVGLLVLGALGGWLAYQTHQNPATVSEERTVATWDEQGSLSHAAEVTEPNPLFEQGRVLSERQVYFTGLSPRFGAGYEYTYGASETGELDVTMNASLRLQSVDDEGATYWAVTEELESNHSEGLSPGETTSLETDLNVSSVAVEIAQIRETLDTNIGTAEAEVFFDTQVTGVVNGENVADTHRRSMVIEPDESTYSVETDDNLVQSHESTEVVQFERSYGPLRLYGPFVLILISVLGLLGLAVATRRGRIRPSPAERAALDRHQQREEFDDWISTGRIPGGSQTGTEIELDSLEDLVDVAIDTNERVIEDTNSGEFFVPGDGRYYTYAMDSPERAAVDDDSELAGSETAEESQEGESQSVLQQLGIASTDDSVRRPNSAEAAGDSGESADGESAGRQRDTRDDGEPTGRDRFNTG